MQRWLDAGLELGNHTYSHADFYVTPLETYKADVLRGERITGRLLATRNMQPLYFRHPFLNTGPDLASKRAFEGFLSAQGYTIAPVTIDNDEWIYARAYITGDAAADGGFQRRIGQDYVRHMSEAFAFHEELSRQLLQREPAQILLVHANALNADWFDELVTMMQARGYGFVSLETTLRDPVYALPDDYVRSPRPVMVATLGRDARRVDALGTISLAVGARSRRPMSPGSRRGTIPPN